MSYERQQEIARLKAQIAELERLEDLEQQMIASGWSVMASGGYRRPVSHRPWWVRNGEFRE